MKRVLFGIMTGIAIALSALFAEPQPEPVNEPMELHMEVAPLPPSAQGYPAPATAEAYPYPVPAATVIHGEPGIVPTVLPTPAPTMTFEGIVE